MQLPSLSPSSPRSTDVIRTYVHLHLQSSQRTSSTSASIFGSHLRPCHCQRRSIAITLPLSLRFIRSSVHFLSETMDGRTDGHATDQQCDLSLVAAFIVHLNGMVAKNTVGFFSSWPKLSTRYKIRRLLIVSV